MLTIHWLYRCSKTIIGQHYTSVHFPFPNKSKYSASARNVGDRYSFLFRIYQTIVALLFQRQNMHTNCREILFLSRFNQDTHLMVGSACWLVWRCSLIYPVHHRRNLDTSNWSRLWEIKEKGRLLKVNIPVTSCFYSFPLRQCTLCSFSVIRLLWIKICDLDVTRSKQ